MHASGSTGSNRAPLLWLILPLIGGITLSGLLSGRLPTGICYAGLGIGAATMIAARRNDHRWWALGIILTGLSFGALHHDHQRQTLPEWAKLPDREVTVVVGVDRIFASAYSHRSFSFGGRVVSAHAPSEEIVGQKVQVQLRRPPPETKAALARGSRLKLIGQLTPLGPDPESEFSAYLADSGYNFRIRQGRWLENTTTPSAYAQARDELRSRAAKILAQDLEDHPERGGARQAMLLGQRHELTDDAKSLFMRSGTMHLFAISGLHIGVIAAVLHGLLRALRISRLTAFIIGSGLLLGYVDLIGQTPSAVRAWLMITCFHGARVWRAPGNSVAAIAASALLVLLWDPMQLFSAGFQMSYAIVFALLLYGVPLGEHWQRLVQPWRDLPVASLSPRQRWVQSRTEVVLMAGALTWAASLIGILSSVTFFGWFTPLAFYANMLLVPLAGLVISGGFVGILCGLVGVGPWALWFTHAAALVLGIMREALRWGLGSGASHPAEFMSAWWGQTGMFLVLAAIVMVREVLSPQNRWRWWGPPLVTILWLVIGLRFT